MQIHVQLFSLLREKAGIGTVDLDLPAHASIAQAVGVLQQRYPALEPHMENVRFAVDMEFVDVETRLAQGDELALIPPVSGG